MKLSCSITTLMWMIVLIAWMLFVVTSVRSVVSVYPALVLLLTIARIYTNTSNLATSRQTVFSMTIVIFGSFLEAIRERHLALKSECGTIFVQRNTDLAPSDA